MLTPHTSRCIQAHSFDIAYDAQKAAVGPGLYARGQEATTRSSLERPGQIPLEELERTGLIHTSQPAEAVDWGRGPMGSFLSPGGSFPTGSFAASCRALATVPACDAFGGIS